MKRLVATNLRKGKTMNRIARRYLRKKTIELLLTIFIVTLLSFLLMRMGAVDPATAYAKRSIGNPTQEQIEQIRIKLGFDKSLIIQYAQWMWNLIHLDLGTSLGNGRLVWGEISMALPKTLRIVILSSVIQSLGIILISSIFFLLPYKLPKKIIRAICIIGISVPSFYVATVYLDFFAVKKNLISVSGNTTWTSSFSPAFCLGIFCISFYVPMLLDELKKESEEDYALYLRSMGFSETLILFKHLLPKAVLGLVPSFMLNIGLCLVDAMIIERVFSVPGFGNLIINAVLERDSPMIHASVFFLALILSICYILSDLIGWKIQRTLEVR
jgi:peptide/nickel transport system permease protein